jgi:hypothetical protein
MINELVKRLSEGKHKVILEGRNDSYEDIKSRINNGFVYINFIETKGTGTEIGIHLDHNKTDITYSDFDEKEGRVRVVGATTLNYNPVRCIVDVDLSTRIGEGYLEVISEEELLDVVKFYY